MSIKYEPKKMLTSKKKIESLLTDRLTVNRAALNAIVDVTPLTKKELEFVAGNVIKKMRERADNLRDEGLTKTEAIEETLENKKLLIQRVKMGTIYAASQKIKEKYFGEYYIWLESSAEDQRPEHIKKYGKKFRIGNGEIPGEAYGCQCGMEILVDAKRLKIK